MPVWELRHYTEGTGVSVSDEEAAVLVLVLVDETAAFRIRSHLPSSLHALTGGWPYLRCKEKQLRPPSLPLPLSSLQ